MCQPGVGLGSDYLRRSRIVDCPRTGSADQETDLPEVLEGPGVPEFIACG